MDMCLVYFFSIVFEFGGIGHGGMKHENSSQFTMCNKHPHTHTYAYSYTYIYLFIPIIHYAYCWTSTKHKYAKYKLKFCELAKCLMLTKSVSVWVWVLVVSACVHGICLFTNTHTFTDQSIALWNGIDQWRKHRTSLSLRSSETDVFSRLFDIIFIFSFWGFSKQICLIWT